MGLRRRDDRLHRVVDRLGVQTRPSELALENHELTAHARQNRALEVVVREVGRTKRVGDVAGSRDRVAAIDVRERLITLLRDRGDGEHFVETLADGEDLERTTHLVDVHERRDEITGLDRLDGDLEVDHVTHERAAAVRSDHDRVQDGDLRLELLHVVALGLELLRLTAPAQERLRDPHELRAYSIELIADGEQHTGADVDERPDPPHVALASRETVLRRPDDRQPRHRVHPLDRILRKRRPTGLVARVHLRFVTEVRVLGVEVLHLPPHHVLFVDRQALQIDEHRVPPREGAEPRLDLRLLVLVAVRHVPGNRADRRVQTIVVRGEGAALLVVEEHSTLLDLPRRHRGNEHTPRQGLLHGEGHIALLDRDLSLDDLPVSGDSTVSTSTHVHATSK